MRRPHPVPLLLFIILTASAMLLTGCAAETDPETAAAESDGTVEHPIEELIPHHDRDHIPINTSRSLDARDDAPAKARFLAAYLEDPDRFERRELDVFVNSASSFKTLSVPGNRLLLMDTQEYRLVEYDLSTDDYVRVAERGEGPEDLQFTMDMARVGSSVHVASPPSRVTTFDCAAAPCEYERLITLDRAPISLAPAGNSFAVLAETVIQPGSSDEADPEEHIVSVVDAEGNIESGFGETYRTEQLLLRSTFLRGAMVRYVEEPGLYVVAHRHLPYLYVYDRDFSLHATYEVEDYSQYRYRTGHQPGSPRAVGHTEVDRSNLYDLRVVAPSSMLLRVAYAPVENESIPRSDYYLVDFAEETSYHVGSDEYEEHSRAIFATDAGLVVNEAGALSFVAM